MPAGLKQSDNLHATDELYHITLNCTILSKIMNQNAASYVGYDK